MSQYKRVGAAVLIVWTSTATAIEPSAERGEKALLSRNFIPPMFGVQAYDAVWKQWDLKQKPEAADYDRLFGERYGFHPAPFANGRYPMGLRKAELPFAIFKGISIDCLMCHGGSIAGRSYVGLGNASLDVQTFLEDMLASHKQPAPKIGLHFGSVRGTTNIGVLGIGNNAGKSVPKAKGSNPESLLGETCEDAPAWWLLKKKKTKYHTGNIDAHSVRTLMALLGVHPLNGAAVLKREEETFTDIQNYLLSLTPPKYPLPIDQGLAKHGAEVFSDHCSRCHGSYGEKWTYPNRVVAIDEIGTDRYLFDSITKDGVEFFNKSWFAKNGEYPMRKTRGYQAPPLDGVWATAPYFHNGSAPTIYHVLNSKARPRIFTRSYRTDLDAYDDKNVGWKVKALDRSPDVKSMSALEFRKIYDTTKTGRSNVGHTYGDRLTEPERRAVIEYLKMI